MWGRLGEEQSVITLVVADPFGCTAKNKVEIAADACCQVVFPSAFTPNADGHNDYFRPLFITLGGQTKESISYHQFHSLRIANRWGQTVFETTSSEGRWDGTFNGAPQDMGVFFYFIKYDCGGKIVEQKGVVTLVR
jgi:gliding motility-associated-like protein